MKKNRNNQTTRDYYIGFDIGTSSVGFAATNPEYNLLRYAGKSIWGTRIFEEGETAVERRTNRTNRRRLSRRNQRLELLKMLFDNEISKIDIGFFMRLKESFLSFEDRSTADKYSLFSDEDFTDKDYMKKYPTIYHLRNELVRDSSVHDVRLVYLAIRHILKNRGHFLFDIDGENNDNFENTFGAFLETLSSIKDIVIDIDSKAAYEIITRKATKPEKVKALLLLCNPSSDVKKTIEKLFALIVGGKAKISDIFEVENTSTAISLDMDEETLLEKLEEIGDDFELIARAKAVYDSLILEKITKGYNFVSEYKIAEYNQHREDIKKLKYFVKAILKNDELYREIFKLKRAKLANYSAYSGYKKGDKEYHATQEEFCKYLKSKLPKQYETDPLYADMYQRINDGIFAPKLRKTENGVIPNGLHRAELVRILENASTYLNFLNEEDENQITTKDKILSIFDFKVPYYVGPLKGGWAVKREDGTVYPWNFESKIDLGQSAERFITEMTSVCTYTAADVLPKYSLLYSEFEVLNEINNIKINGEPIPVSCKLDIYNDLFVKNEKKVTKKLIEEYLRQKGLISNTDTVSGVDSSIKSQLVSYHKMKNILSKTSYEQVEEIIKRITLFGEDKRLLKKYLKAHTSLSDEDIKYVLKQKFEGWGSLSKELLSEIEAVNPETGEIVNIITMMRETNLNLMKILSSDFMFKSSADKYKAQRLGVAGTPREMVDALYVSPKIRRSIWQTLRILDEIVDIERGAPSKIFIEVARENETDDKKAKNAASRRSRKEQLISWYKECKQASTEIFERLENEKEEHLRSKRLFLYYLQFGKCMYSGEPIDISELENNFKYDIDHIFPRSKIKDDSIDNLVLVKAELNREKTNVYPINEKIRREMTPFWAMLKDRGTVSQKKYDRLVRHTPLTEDELRSFIDRQLVETRQSTKAVAELLKIIYPNTKIVYSKATNVTEFRRYFCFTKCRDINDHHHAKDAYLNIVVGNYFDTSFTVSFLKNILTEEYSLKPEALYGRNVHNAWVKGETGTISTVRATMKKNNVLFTIMPKEEHGQLYDVTIMPKGKGQVPIKSGLDINRYGGYNKASGAYFAIVEHEEKGIKIRTVETVLKLQKVEYEKNPLAFARKHWYDTAVVILEKVLFNSIFEIDGVRLSITKRQNDQIGFVHTYQLVLSNGDYNYIKSIMDFLEKYGDKNESPSKSKMLYSERNIEIYEMLIEKIKCTVYSKIIGGIAKYMEESREKFATMSILDQCKTIKEIMKAFRCNASLTSLDLLCGKGSVGSILKSKKISSAKSVYLIHQSITGIFEKRVNLLK